MRMRQLALLGVLILAACGGGDELRPGADQATASSVPEEFRAACGKPGSEVLTERLSVVVKRADCDLTGVVIKNRSGGATVPVRGEAVTGSSNSGTVTIQVDQKTGDVTFTAESDDASHAEHVPTFPPSSPLDPPTCDPGYECSDSGHGDVPADSAHGVRHAIYSHCGVHSTTVDGVLWLADPPLGDHNPPPGWDDNDTPGVFTVRSQNDAVFTADSGVHAHFVKAPPGSSNPGTCE